MAARYSPRRRSSMFSQIGGPIIGGMGKGYRPFVGEDIDQNETLSHYEKVFVKRLRFEAAKDPTLRRDNTEASKESFSKICAMKAQYYTEKRLLRDLWKAWRKDYDQVPLQEAGDSLPPASNSDAPSGAVSAMEVVRKRHTPLADTKNPDAPQGAGRAEKALLEKVGKGLPDHQSPDASQEASRGYTARANQGQSVTAPAPIKETA